MVLIRRAEIAFANKSTVATDAECSLMAMACDAQLRQHVAPAWRADLEARGLPTEPACRFYGRDEKIPATAWPIYVLDDADMQNALGWHSVDDHGRPFGRVFARDARNARWPLSVVGSHEACEAFCDPLVNIYREGYALEVCDPVEGDTYPIIVTLGGNDEDGDDGTPGVRKTVRVSNVVLPSWFVGTTQRGTPVDYMGKARGPHQITPGGYVMTAGAVSAFSAGYPDWRVGTKLEPGSRTWRRANALRGEEGGG